MSIPGVIRRALSRPAGWWQGPGFARHPGGRCPLPPMPPRCPPGLSWQCPACDARWTWVPAYRWPWSRTAQPLAVRNRPNA